MIFFITSASGIVMCRGLRFTVLVEYCRAMLVDHLDLPQQDVWIVMLTLSKPTVVV